MITISTLIRTSPPTLHNHHLPRRRSPQNRPPLPPHRPLLIPLTENLHTPKQHHPQNPPLIPRQEITQIATKQLLLIIRKLPCQVLDGREGFRRVAVGEHEAGGESGRGSGDEAAAAGDLGEEGVDFLFERGEEAAFDVVFEGVEEGGQAEG